MKRELKSVQDMQESDFQNSVGRHDSIGKSKGKSYQIDPKGKPYTNDPIDQAMLRALLNAIPESFGGTSHRLDDGDQKSFILKDDLYKAIIRFQGRWTREEKLPVDGHVDPHDKTLKKLLDLAKGWTGPPPVVVNVPPRPELQKEVMVSRTTVEHGSKTHEPGEPGLGNPKITILNNVISEFKALERTQQHPCESGDPDLNSSVTASSKADVLFKDVMLTATIERIKKFNPPTSNLGIFEESWTTTRTYTFTYGERRANSDVQVTRHIKTIQHTGRVDTDNTVTFSAAQPPNLADP